MDGIEIGIIGAGDMGLLYARKFAGAGFRVNICDKPEEYENLREKVNLMNEKVNYLIYPLADGFAVSRRSDYIFYSVEAFNIRSVVKLYGKATKFGAIVGGQTSVKRPEIEAFLEYLHDDVNIVSVHSLHGPRSDTKGQTLAVIRCRATEEKFQLAVDILKSLESEMLFITAEEHDKITANTQAATHICYLSLGTAWKNQGYYPWENPMFSHNIDNVKISITLHIYGSKSHVYSGLAIMNDMAKVQIRCYVESMSTLYKYMIGGQKQQFRDLVHAASEAIFEPVRKNPENKILLLDRVLDQISMTDKRVKGVPNSHLSLLATAVCWYKMGVDPYHHLICQTPPFRLWLGIVEYLFCDKDLLEESIETALSDKVTQAEDLMFFVSVLGWEQCIQLNSFDGFKQRFDSTKDFFIGRIDEAKSLASKIINILAEERLEKSCHNNSVQ
ncbi:putative prephenate dehydrogenase [NADP(+)] [Smittium mucronatum]|uniref:Putative prephenate dehydrogenase [NADP(+)] n=1 Tax=Smittium mucronatum TaxID=133383 RepID=A0A1R0H2V6_9FUNG|nr:putative prephenate dehydrogenase [NADP(+)] [Smittium mucronatum]